MKLFLLIEFDSHSFALDVSEVEEVFEAHCARGFADGFGYVDFRDEKIPAADFCFAVSNRKSEHLFGTRCVVLRAAWTDGKLFALVSEGVTRTVSVEDSAVARVTGIESDMEYFSQFALEERQVKIPNLRPLFEKAKRSLK